MASEPSTAYARPYAEVAAFLRQYRDLMQIILLAAAAVNLIDPLARIFGVQALTFAQWTVAIGIALTLLAVEEIIKIAVRRSSRPAVPVTAPAAAG